MDIGATMAMLDAGAVVTRAKWQDKRVLLLAGGYSVAKDKLRQGTPITPKLLDVCGLDRFIIEKHIDMFDGKTYHTGYNFSIEDQLADDWYIVENIIDFFKKGAE